jgi:ATP-binding cassette, subfamily F, member 3
LKNYEGTFIVVSHDREFLDGLTNRIWDIENKTLKIHHFGVHEFLKRKMQTEDSQQITSESIKIESSIIDKPIVSYEEAKELKRKKNQLNNQIRKCEELISTLEKKIVEMDNEIASLDYTNEEVANNLLGHYEKVKIELDQTMTTWEKSTEELMDLGS